MFIFYRRCATFHFDIHTKGHVTLFWHTTRKSEAYGGDIKTSLLSEKKFYGVPTTYLQECTGQSKNIRFDMIEISASEYTEHRLCITLWLKGSNVIRQDMNYLGIEELPILLARIGYNMTDKAKKTLNQMLARYAKKWKFPHYILP